MPCPHGSGTAEQCSQCQGAKPRVVEHQGGNKLTVDGKPAQRGFVPPTNGRNGPPRRGR